MKSLIFSLAAAFPILGLPSVSSAATCATVYEHPGFGGHSIDINTDLGINIAVFCMKENWASSAFGFACEKRWNDQASSLRVYSIATVWEHVNLSNGVGSGKAISFGPGEYDLASYDFDDKLSAISCGAFPNTLE